MRTDHVLEDAADTAAQELLGDVEERVHRLAGGRDPLDLVAPRTGGEEHAAPDVVASQVRHPEQGGQLSRQRALAAPWHTGDEDRTWRGHHSHRTGAPDESTLTRMAGSRS
jgi:hypothetical protein